MSKLAALAETKEGVSWGEGGASRRLFLKHCALPSPKVPKGALLACFSPASGIDEGAEPLSAFAQFTSSESCSVL